MIHFAVHTLTVMIHAHPLHIPFHALTVLFKLNSLHFKVKLSELEFEVQVQGRFKHKPTGVVYIGGEIAQVQGPTPSSIFHKVRLP